MKESRLLESRAVSEVASLLIPLADRQLLLPTVTVAEMVPYTKPERDPEAPDWYLGDIMWREARVPLVSYEVMCGEPMPSFNGKSRIAVLNNTGVDEKLPFLAIATQGIPRLSRVKAEEIHELEGAKLALFDLMHVTHAGESVVIPDVAALEQAFLDYKKGGLSG
ncbi:MAG: chemotaxis protein CheW [Cellvibrionaceae bacterium]